MRWQKDIVDLWCADWASQRRRMLGLSELQPKERLGRLSSTLGSIREDRDGASQGTVSQSFPEVYIGPAPNYPLLVNRAWKQMDKRWRPIIEVHYVWQGEKVRYKAEQCSITVALYWKYLTFGKSYIDSFVHAYSNHLAEETA